MDRDAVVRIAMETLAKNRIQEGFQCWKAYQEQRNDRSIWIVIFALKEQEDVVTTPDTISVEVDEKTQSATITLSP